MTREGIRARTNQRGLRRRIPIAGSRVTTRLDRIRCRGLSRPSNLGTVLQVNRQAMGEGAGRDGRRTVGMGLESFCCSACIFHFSIRNCLRIGIHDSGRYNDWTV